MRPHLPLAPSVWIVLLMTVATGGTAYSDHWPGWRGPSGDGLSAETDLPRVWSTEEGITWKTPLPGRGHSSPIVWGDFVFVTAADEQSLERRLICLDRRDGKNLWNQLVLTAPLEPVHPLNSYASSTPAADGQSVFITFLDKEDLFVAAYSLAGEKIWESRPGSFASKHGFCSNPVIHGDRLIINGDHDGESYLALLSKSDGQVIWKVPREHKTRSYSVPRVITIDGREQVVLTGSFATSGFDLETGELIWSVDGPSEQMVASVLHQGDFIFAMGGYPERHLLAIRKGGKGDVTSSHIVWRTHRSIPYVPSALLYDNLLHVVSDEGIYTCFDPATGKVHSNKRVSKHISGSLVGGDGCVYITDDEGTTTVLRNAPGFEVLATNRLEEPVYSSMAVSQGSLFIRGDKHLYRIDKAGK